MDTKCRKGSQREEEYSALDAFDGQDESHRKTEVTVIQTDNKENFPAIWRAVIPLYILLPLHTPLVGRGHAVPTHLLIP